jgi:flagella basal body P-ring formation protein FlgA
MWWLRLLVTWVMSIAGIALIPRAAWADEAERALAGDVAQRVRALAQAGAPRTGAGVTRVAIDVGQLNPRLRLAPCARIEPYLPANARLWGKTRIGLRCTEGPSRWNVYLPVQVRVFAKALVAATPLAAGRVIDSTDMVTGEVDLAEEGSPAVVDMRVAAGRTLARALHAGQSVRESHLKTRQWFAAGDTVKVIALGPGFSVAGEGQALTPGMEGQPARVKTESGRVLTGEPVGERRMQLAL